MPSSRNIWPFFRTVLAVVTGLCVFSGIFVLLFVFVIGVATEEKEDNAQAAPIKKGAVLQLALKDKLREIGNDEKPTPTTLLSSFFGKKKEQRATSVPPGLLGLSYAIRQAKTDPKIAGISITFDNLTAGQAQLKELQHALQDFKSSGKFVYGYADNLSELAHYLTSSADTLLVSPHGRVEFDGFLARFSFYKGTLDKVGITPRVFRTGKYKSAVESLTRSDLSSSSREQYEVLLNGMYDQYLADIAHATGSTSATLRKIAAELKVVNATDAHTHALVTQLGYYATYEALLRTRLRLKEDEKIPWVSIKKYIKSLEKPIDNKNIIAVIIAEGDIHDKGTKDGKDISPQNLVPLLKRAAEREDVKAIVLRINSPGGGVFGSDEIWHEIGLVAQKKPVIASLSSVAASGGYYLAMACDKILAYPNTITGSIGVFYLFFEREDLSKKLGISEDHIQTAPQAAVSNYGARLAPAQARVLQEAVEEFYQTFLKKVAKSRKMRVEDVHKIAQGRVWTGTDALAHGLIDKTGYFQDALDLAAKSAAIEDYATAYILPVKEFELRTFLLHNMRIPEMWIKRLMPAPLIDAVVNKDPLPKASIQARMRYQLNIQ